MTAKLDSLNYDTTAQPVIPIMYYNLCTNARGHQGRHSQANVIAALSEAKVESMGSVIANASLKAGKCDSSKKSILRLQAAPFLCLNGLRKPLPLDLVLTPQMTEHKNSTDATKAMVAVPDDIDIDNGQLKDATDQAGYDIALVSSSCLTQHSHH